MKRYLALLLFCMAAVVVAQEEKVEEKEMKIPLTMKVSVSSEDPYGINIIIQARDAILISDSSKIMGRTNLIAEDDAEETYFVENCFLNFKPLSPPVKSKEKTGEELKLEWGIRVAKRDLDSLDGKPLHLKGFVYYDVPVKVVNVDPPQPLVMKKGERLVWEDLVLEICTDPVVATSMSWDWEKKTYIAKQEEEKPLYFHVPFKVEAPEGLELWDEKFFNLSSKEFKPRGVGSHSPVVDGKEMRLRFFQFPTEHECEELLMSLNYVKSRIRYRIPVDQKVIVPEMKQDQKKEEGVKK